MDQKREVKYIILGKPVPWARPGKSKYSHGNYDTQKAQKEEYAWHFKLEHKDQELFTGPIHLDLLFMMPITNNQDKRKKERDGEPHIFTPDLTNLCKFIEDAASKGVLFHDDCIVASISARKIWDRVPRTEMTIREL